MRALTGYDRVTLTCGERRAEAAAAPLGGPVDPAALPIFVADTRAGAVSLFPRDERTARPMPR